MTEIVINPEYAALLKKVQELRERLSVLLAEKDDLLCHVCENVEATYMVKIGVLEHKAFELQVKVLRLKRKITLIQAKINRQEKVSETEIETQLNAEYADYAEKLQEQMKAINAALHHGQLGGLSAEDSKELKTLYRQIVKKLHPDINPNQSETDKKLFLNALDAYKNSDLDTLRAISILKSDTPDTITANAFDELNKQEELFDERCRSVSEEIDKIKQSFPYDQMAFLENEDAVKERTQELNKTIEGYRTEHKTLEDRLSDLLWKNNG